MTYFKMLQGKNTEGKKMKQESQSSNLLKLSDRHTGTHETVLSVFVYVIKLLSY